MQTAASPARKNNKRDADTYVIEAFLNGLLVFEALEGNNFEPVSLKTIARRSKQSENFCYRALKTLEQMGYARRTESGWYLGSRIARLSEAYEVRFNA